MLQDMLHHVLDNSQIEMEAVHPLLHYPETGRTMELDIYFPSIKLALEYQGEQHFHWTFQGGNPTHQQVRDHWKMDACNRENITLITIPFWWDRDPKSLLATIGKYRVDLVPDCKDASPIPLEPPIEFSRKYPHKIVEFRKQYLIQ
jgi:hypothetical protein